MLFVDYYSARAPRSSSAERRVVIYKSVRAAKHALEQASGEVESRHLICEDSVAEGLLRAVDENGYCDIEARRLRIG